MRKLFSYAVLYSCSLGRTGSAMLDTRDARLGQVIVDIVL